MENDYPSKKFTSSQLIKYALEEAEEGFGHWHEEIERILGNVEMAIPESVKAINLGRKEKQTLAWRIRNFSQENLIMLLLSIGNEVSNGKIVEVKGLVSANYNVNIETRKEKIYSVASSIRALTHDRENSFQIEPPGAAIYRNYHSTENRNPLRNMHPCIVSDAIRAFIPQMEEYAQRAIDTKVKIHYNSSVAERKI